VSAARRNAAAVRIELGDWAQLRRWAEPIRTTVFVDEQKVPADMEVDAQDPLSLHAVAFAGERAVGTGRLLPDGHIGRMAVLAEARGQGVGSALLTTLMAQAQARGHAAAVLSAQTHAVEFYRRHGYAVVSGEYLDCGIPHVDMRCPLLP
jgi:predicted GNAT family N-acyltransferase